MSNIDIERLKVDREYWDSVAPEGAEFVFKWKPVMWYRDRGRLVWSKYSEKWLHSESFEIGQVGEHNLIPRPPKKAQEWDGLAIEVKDGRIFRVTIPEEFKYGSIKISGATVEIQR